MSEPEKKPRRRVKKVKGHGGHHGGAWKVAYADFVTAMMALFLVLWLVSQADTKVKQAIANYFRAPGVFDTMQGGIINGPKKVSKEPSPMTSKDEEQALFTTAEVLKKKFETRPEFGKYKDQIKIDVTDEGLKIQILDQAERVSFGSGSAELTPNATAILAEISRSICQMPNPILIGGHTDRHVFPEGSTYTNWELSADRANAARRVLEANCVKPEQIRRIVGYADTDLFVPDDPYAAANRRISITVLRMHSPGEGEQAGDKIVEKADGKDEEKSDEKLSAKAAPEPSTGKAAKDSVGKAEKDEAEPPARKDVKESPASGKVKAEANLKGESISVGEPDRLPANVKRTRESAMPK